MAEKTEQELNQDKAKKSRENDAKTIKEVIVKVDNFIVDGKPYKKGDKVKVMDSKKIWLLGLSPCPIKKEGEK